MLQILDNLRQLSIFSNYIGEIDPFTLTSRKGPTAGPSEEFLISLETYMKQISVISGLCYIEDLIFLENNIV